MCQKTKVDKGGSIAVAPLRMTRSGCRIADNRYFKALLEKLPEVGLDAKIREHSPEHDSHDPPLAELQDKVVGLRSEHFMGADDHRLPIVNVGLETRQPVRPRVSEAVDRERPLSGKTVVRQFDALKRPSKCHS